MEACLIFRSWLFLIKLKGLDNIELLVTVILIVKEPHLFEWYYLISKVIYQAKFRLLTIYRKQIHPQKIKVSLNLEI